MRATCTASIRSSTPPICDTPPARVSASLEKLTGAKGRLELAGSKNGAPIFIDYAHKPDAMAKALASLRPYTSGRLVVVFGAGGEPVAIARPAATAAFCTWKPPTSGSFTL